LRKHLQIRIKISRMYDASWHVEVSLGTLLESGRVYDITDRLGAVGTWYY
jgi:hypothetical protein